jgi:hypothetical protein
VSTNLLIVLSVLLAVVVVAVLALALIEVRRGLGRISDGSAVKAINAQFEIILGALPGIGKKAALVAEKRPR